MIRILFVIILFCSSCVTNRPVEDYGRLTVSALFNNGQEFKGYGASTSLSYNWVVDQERQIWLGPEYSFLYGKGEQKAENTLTGNTEWVEHLSKKTHLLGARIEFGNRTAIRAGIAYEEQEIERRYKTYKVPSELREHSSLGYYIGLQNDLPLSENIFLTPAFTFYTLDGQANAAIEFGITLGF